MVFWEYNHYQYNFQRELQGHLESLGNGRDEYSVELDNFLHTIWIPKVQRLGYLMEHERSKLLKAHEIAKPRAPDLEFTPPSWPW